MFLFFSSASNINDVHFYSLPLNEQNSTRLIFAAMFEVCGGHLILENEVPEMVGEVAGVVSISDVG